MVEILKPTTIYVLLLHIMCMHEHKCLLNTPQVDPTVYLANGKLCGSQYALSLEHDCLTGPWGTIMKFCSGNKGILLRHQISLFHVEKKT